jgi:hypothetical protein
VAGVGGPGDVGGIADRAIAASAVWARAALPSAERDTRPLFGPIAGDAFADGVETIYEGYLVHHAPRGRVFAPADREQGLLLGDYLYASGLVRVCAVGDVDAIAALADLVSLAAHLRAEDRPLDGELWLATAHYLAGDRGGDLEAAREALRAGDGEPLLRLAAKDPAEIVQQHRRHMGDTA